MTGHRRTPNRRGFIPPAWAVVGAVVVCLAAAGWVGVLLINGDDTDSASPTVTATTPTPSATTPSPDPSTEPTATEPTVDEPTVERTAPVSVLNNTTIANLATTYSQQVQQKGWTISGVGNWRGQIVSNTVYYPAGLEDQGRLLAEDMGIDRVKPSIAPMKSDRLTIILSGPQQ